MTVLRIMLAALLSTVRAATASAPTPQYLPYASWPMTESSPLPRQCDVKRDGCSGANIGYESLADHSNRSLSERFNMSLHNSWTDCQDNGGASYSNHALHFNGDFAACRAFVKKVPYSGALNQLSNNQKAPEPRFQPGSPAGFSFSAWFSFDPLGDCSSTFSSSCPGSNYGIIFRIESAKPSSGSWKLSTSSSCVTRCKVGASLVLNKDGQFKFDVKNGGNSGGNLWSRNVNDTHTHDVNGGRLPISRGGVQYGSSLSSCIKPSFCHFVVTTAPHGPPAKDGVMRLFVDGRQISEKITDGKNMYDSYMDSNGYQNVVFGSYAIAGSSSSGLRGSMSKIAFYNRPLSPTEIQTLFAANISDLGLIPGATAEPTASPSAAPSSSPSASPTLAPTSAPSLAPTASPNAATTISPTASPSLAPTASPSSAPSSAPTPGPISGSTSAPTASPSRAPTASPTSAPTKEPTTHGSGGSGTITPPGGGTGTGTGTGSGSGTITPPSSGGKGTAANSAKTKTGAGGGGGGGVGMAVGGAVGALVLLAVGLLLCRRVHKKEGGAGAGASNANAYDTKVTNPVPFMTG